MGIFLTDGVGGPHLTDDVSGEDLVDNSDEASAGVGDFIVFTTMMSFLLMILETDAVNNLAAKIP